jgi:hypothetical protein
MRALASEVCFSPFAEFYDATTGKILAWKFVSADFKGFLCSSVMKSPTL